MKYTENNVLGLRIAIDSSRYIVKIVNKQLGLWGRDSKGIYNIHCGHTAATIAECLNNPECGWKVEELQYEIY